MVESSKTTMQARGCRDVVLPFGFFPQHIVFVDDIDHQDTTGGKRAMASELSVQYRR